MLVINHRTCRVASSQVLMMRTLVTSVAVLIVSQSIGYAEVKIMPGELVEFAELNGCSQLSDFYEMNYGPVGPPYVYGYLGESSQNAAFWCKSVRSHKVTYFLIFMFKYMPRPFNECPDKVQWHRPAGLSVYRDKRATLKDFVYLDDPKRKAPQNVRLSHDAIMSEFDGMEDLFYCYEDKWLVRSRVTYE
ncbi:MAG: hypothetical protein ACREIS_07070 [Nitrospiraceae bacterium]